MKLFIHEAVESECGSLLESLHRKAAPQLHELVDSPEQADLILVTGSYTAEGLAQKVTKSQFIRKHADKVVAYNDDDAYLPLLPGTYCSPMAGRSTSIGRARTYSYIVRHLAKGNPFIRPVAGDARKELLFSFQGRCCAPVRKRMMRFNYGRDDVFIENTSSFSNWGRDTSVTDRQQLYVDTVHRSHFGLCPRGGGTGSFRFFETMQMAVAPVLLSDGFVLPEGPDWDSFLITVPERDVARLPEILEPHRDESRERGRLARLAWEQWFDTDKEFNEIVDRCAKAHEASRAGEATYRAFWPLLVTNHYAKRAARRNASKVVRTLARRAGVKVQNFREGVEDYDLKSNIEKAKSL